MHRNSIVEFYSGTLDVEGNVKYLIFDLDPSPFLTQNFSRGIIWELLIDLSTAIVKVAKEFLGCENFPVQKYSGGKGIHICFRYDSNIFSSKYNRLNLENYFYTLPGIWELVKSKNSPIRSPASFNRLIAESIIVYMIYLRKYEIKIPKEIIEKFGKIHPRHLFKISVFSPNLAAMLVDCSPDASGVFRTGFSLNSSTRRVSIPLACSRTGQIFEDLLDWNTLKKEADFNTVLNNLNDNPSISNRYFQLKNSSIIRKEDIENLLKPDRLLPVIAFVLRFGRRFIFERTEGSFRYWYNYYQILFFFQYVERMVLRCKKEETLDLYQDIVGISKNCWIITEKSVCDLTHSHLIKKEISYPIFLDRLKGLYHYEFYFRINPSPISFEKPDKVKELILEKMARKEFSDKLTHISLILLDIFSRIANYPSLVSTRRGKALIALSLHLKKFYKIRKKSEKMIATNDKKFETIYDSLLLILFYNIIINFLKVYFRFSEIARGA